MFQHEKFTYNEGRGIVCAYEIACFLPVCFSSTTRLLKFLSSIRCYWRIDVSHHDLKIVCQLATIREQFEPFRLKEKTEWIIKGYSQLTVTSLLKLQNLNSFTCVFSYSCVVWISGDLLKLLPILRKYHRPKHTSDNVLIHRASWPQKSLEAWGQDQHIFPLSLWPSRWPAEPEDENEWQPCSQVSFAICLQNDTCAHFFQDGVIYVQYKAFLTNFFPGY